MTGGGDTPVVAVAALAVAGPVSSAGGVEATLTAQFWIDAALGCGRSPCEIAAGGSAHTVRQVLAIIEQHMAS